MAIPGCDGGEENNSRSDYCILDPAATEPDESNEAPSEGPTTTTSTNPTTSPSAGPTTSPSMQPSTIPSQQPSTRPSNSPSDSPSVPSTVPSNAPTIWLDTEAPVAPTASISSISPSFTPSISPSSMPSAAPSSPPSAQPTNTVNAGPTSQPTEMPDLVDYGADPISRYPLGLCEGDVSLKR
jgi:hypothetical protein